MPSCVCSNVRRAARVLTQVYDAALAPSGLKVMQLETLDTLMDFAPATLSRIAEANRHERSAVWRGLQPLIKRGLVRLAAEPDGRQDRYELTDAGRAAFEEGVRLWRGAQDRVLAQLGPDHAHLMTIVGKIDAIGKAEAEAGK